MTIGERSRMGPLAKAMAGIRVLGWRRSFQVVRFTARKLWLDWRHAPPAPDWDAPGVAPGPLASVEASERGARYRFARAELEIEFLTSDLVRVTWRPGADPVPYAIAR